MEPEPPPEARLIADKRKNNTRYSHLEAGRRAGISAARWRQLELGYFRVRKENFPERAPADTLARMAWVVGATPAELRAAGRADAADELKRMPDDDGELEREARAILDQIAVAKHLTDRQKAALSDRVLRELRQ
jgi:hypothetical protein